MVKCVVHKLVMVGQELRLKTETGLGLSNPEQSLSLPVQVL